MSAGRPWFDMVQPPSGTELLRLNNQVYDLLTPENRSPSAIRDRDIWKLRIRNPENFTRDDGLRQAPEITAMTDDTLIMPPIAGWGYVFNTIRRSYRHNISIADIYIMFYSTKNLNANKLFLTSMDDDRFQDFLAHDRDLFDLNLRFVDEFQSDACDAVEVERFTQMLENSDVIIK